MEVISILWQFSLISLILSFAVELGLSAGLNNINKKNFAIICGLYGGTLLIIAPFMYLIQELAQYINNYIIILYYLIAVILILVSLSIIKEYKEKGHVNNKYVIKGIIATYPCCILSIILDIVIIAPTIGIKSGMLCIYSLVILIVVMIIAYVTSKFLRISKPPSLIISNYMLLLAEYYIFSALILPNLSTALQKTNGMIIHSSEYIQIFLVVFIILLVLGIILNKKYTILK